MCYANGAISREFTLIHREGWQLSKRDITITAGSVTVGASLNGSATATQIWEALPIEASASTWGDEIYFGIPVEGTEEPDQEVVEFGDLGYWPPGSAFCMFFGPTPMSRGDEIRPASAVSVIGSMNGDLESLKSVPSGAPVLVERT